MAVWEPWAEGKATRLNDGSVVGSFALKAEYAAEGWRCTAVVVDEEGVFVTATFERCDTLDASSTGS